MPGMSGAIRSTSSSACQVTSAEAGTVNSWSSSIRTSKVPSEADLTAMRPVVDTQPASWASNGRQYLGVQDGSIEIDESHGQLLSPPVDRDLPEELGALGR